MPKKPNNPRGSASVRPVSAVTLSEQVANQVIDMIAARRWKPGEKLPTEFDLCEAFSVSRSTLREALKSLAFAGFVRMRAGEGTFVADHPPIMLGRVKKSRASIARDLGYVLETRYSLESRVAMLCAKRATTEDLEKIEALINEMQECIDKGGDGFLEMDIEFHLALADACKNPFLNQFMHVLREPVLHIMHVLKGSGLERSQAEHLRILDALKERNPEKAHHAMQDHLRRYWRHGTVFFDAEETNHKVD